VRALLLLAATLTLGPGMCGQNPPPKPPEGAESASPALDWDRDFDLILESRQGNDRENAAKSAKVEALQHDLEKLRKEEEELTGRIKIFSGNVTGEEAFSEMLRLEAGTPERARSILETQLAEVRSRITDLERALIRAKKAKR
jgi:hypothetical protein